MPLFNWHAVDQTGNVRRGSSSARSPVLLEQQLRREGFVTLLTYQQKDRGSCSYQELSSLFENIGSMLASGVRLTDALAVVEHSAGNTYLATVIGDSRNAVTAGITWAEACSYHPRVFPVLVSRLLQAGQESGTFAQACEQLSTYYAYRAHLYQKIRSALLIPAVTLSCFLFVTLMIMLLVVPRFELLFNSLHQSLPARTRFLMGVSQTLQQPSAWCVISFLGVTIVYGCWRLFHSPRTISVLASVPGLGNWVVEGAHATFFRMLGMLLQGRVDMGTAITLAAESMNLPNYYAAAEAVKAGFSVSEAVKKADIELSGYCRALIVLGETTGTMGVLIGKCADYYQQQFDKRLRFFTLLVQPLLLVVLGLLIAALMLVVYEPIFSLSDTLG